MCYVKIIIHFLFKLYNRQDYNLQLLSNTWYNINQVIANLTHIWKLKTKKKIKMKQINRTNVIIRNL